jgi:hypothetical protein
MMNRITTVVLVTVAASLMVLVTNACNIKGCSQCNATDPDWCETCGDGYRQNPFYPKECKRCETDDCKTCAHLDS